MALYNLLPRQSLGNQIGTGLGQGLSTGLQLLAQQKLQDLAQRQTQMQNTQGLEALGFAPEEASSLALLDPTLQKEVVRQKLLAPQQQAFAQSLQSILGQPQQPAGLPALGQQAIEQASAVPELTGLTEKQAGTLAKLGLQKQQATEKLQFAKEKEGARQKAEAFKITKDERKQINDAARDARKSLKDLDRLEELQQENKLDTPGYVELLKRTGLDIPALMNPGSEEFQKIAANFIGAARTAIGGRVTNFELEQFLKTIPSLSQSPEGRKRVIANLKYLNRAAVEYSNALKEVIQQNNGIPPFDLAERVDDKIEKKLEVLAKKFKEDLAKPVPAGQNKFITALQAIGGNLLTGPGKLLGGIGNLFGSHIPAIPV